MRRLGQTFVILGAAMAFASAWLHGFMARPVVLGRLPADLAPATREGINAAWILGTAAMATLALLALLGLRGLGREPGGWRAPGIGGLFFLGYGAWGYAYRHGHPHFIGFMAIGLLWIVGAILAERVRVPR